MNVEFLSGPVSPSASPIAYVVDQGNLPAGLEPVVAEGAAASRFAGKPGQCHEAFVTRDGAVVRLALAGAGEPGSKDRSAALERAGAALTAKYLASGETALTIDFTGTRMTGGEAASVLLGARLRGWRYDTYRTRLPEEQKVSLKTIKVAGAPEGTEAAWAVEAALAEGIEFTRELVTEPANVIYPASFVERAHQRLDGTGVRIRVLDRDEMAALGMGALLGVAQGSVREPKLLVMEWNGGAAGEKPTAFVGKGVTFDTGGISLKPPGGMEDMKWDMGGAGAVAGAMLALAKR
ncbi:MAG TPA: M17 family peptidase N-terminal domain-containing protein, partial [Novosphingobium sp.]|nr:M17 family peptidase N-terminal domain-containing protein [Novosphingobium sp.]